MMPRTESLDTEDLEAQVLQAKKNLKCEHYPQIIFNMRGCSY